VVGEVLRRGERVAAGGEVAALVPQVGREDLQVVAGAARQDLDHDAVGAHVEEAQCLQGVAVGVARRVGGRAVRRGDARAEIVAGAGGLGAAEREQREGGGKPHR